MSSGAPVESHPHHHHSSSLHRVITRRAVLSAAVGSAGTALLAACGAQGAKGHSASSTGSSPTSSPSVSPFTSPSESPATQTASATPTGSPSVSKAASASPAAARPSVESSPESLRCLVNKMRPFAQKDWAPSDLVDFEGQQLRAEAAQAARTMMDAAKAEGVTLTVSSAYRSYAVQQQTYQHWVSVNGQKVADQLSARPGYSEHQTGLAIDFSSPEGCRLEECYEDTRAGRWLAKNAQNYGFILRFPKGQQAVTGYLFEPWHYRYLGKDLTARYVASGANTLEEFLGTGAAPDYVS
ncbi:MAG: D-alanyl-D-alanine carboxypeptidase family protein [Rothia mucilaginosa]|nr:D-alanyl-D-alanine carboxypeptidase family protein [Rothia mucilaginosa]